MASRGTPSLHRLARGLLEGGRVGGARPAGAGFARLLPAGPGSPGSVARIADVTCLVYDQGSNCGGEDGQCLVLSYAHGTGVSGKDLRGMTATEVEAACVAYEAAGGMSMGVEAGFVRSLMHDVRRGHANDVHLALHFFPQRLRDRICTLVKVKEDGSVAVDVLDLRPIKTPRATAFHCILVNDGHARSLQLPSQWSGQEGPKLFLEAVRSRGAVVEHCQWRGWRGPMPDQSGPRVAASGQVACELCGEPRIRTFVHDTEGMAGRVRPVRLPCARA